MVLVCRWFQSIARFGHWAGQLGDGRVATLGELRTVGDRDKLTGIASTWCGRLVEVRVASPLESYEKTRGGGLSTDPGIMQSHNSCEKTSCQAQ